MLEAPFNEKSLSLDPAPTPDQDRIAPLALLFLDWLHVGRALSVQVGAAHSK